MALMHAQRLPTIGEMTTLSVLLTEPASPNQDIMSAESPSQSRSSRVTRDAVWNWCATPQKILQRRAHVYVSAGRLESSTGQELGTLAPYIGLGQYSRTWGRE
jgi:hypothetical protein